MKNFNNVEVISLSVKNGKLVALLSYQDKEQSETFPNNGYDTIEVPVNIRDIQMSANGNFLVDQSVKDYQTVVANNETNTN